VPSDLPKTPKPLFYEVIDFKFIITIFIIKAIEQETRTIFS